MQVSILIVEDEGIVAMNLSAGLEHDGYHVVGIADNAAEAVDLFKEHEVDIVLMDINIIGDKDGITTAAELMKIKQVPVIFLTAFTDADTVSRVKLLQPAAFLTKPYNINNVRIAIDLALNNFAIAKEHQSGARVFPIEEKNKPPKETAADKETILQLNDHIFVKNNYQFVKIKLSDILYAEADNNYCNITTGEKKFSLRLSLNSLLEKIHFKKLIRIHRSFAVNIDAISSFNDHDVMIEKHELPIGRNYKEDFLKQFDFN
ncbi:MAG: response regulator [Bacteroidota bacterium]